MLDALERGDSETVVASMSGDAQGVDELSRRWLRNGDAITEYVRQLQDAVEDFRFDLRDVHERRWGEIGLVTCWVEQDYTLQGERQHVSAPTSVVLRREGSDWRIVLFHSVPLPQGLGL